MSTVSARSASGVDVHRASPCDVLSFAVYAATAAACVIVVVFSSLPAMANGAKSHSITQDLVTLAPPRSRDPRELLGMSDEIATLEAVQIALTDVADGGTYVWYRTNGRMSGVVTPVSSHLDPLGRVCRQLDVTLSSGSYSRQTRGTACRDDTGNWTLGN